MLRSPSLNTSTPLSPPGRSSPIDISKLNKKNVPIPKECLFHISDTDSEASTSPPSPETIRLSVPSSPEIVPCTISKSKESLVHKPTFSIPKSKTEDILKPSLFHNTAAGTDLEKPAPAFSPSLPETARLSAPPSLEIISSSTSKSSADDLNNEQSLSIETASSALSTPLVQNQESTPKSLINLPDDVFYHLLTFLPYEDRFKVTGLSQKSYVIPYNHFQTKSSITLGVMKDLCLELIKKAEKKDGDPDDVLDIKLRLSQNVYLYFLTLYNTFTRKNYTHPHLQPILANLLGPALLEKIQTIFKDYPGYRVKYQGGLPIDWRNDFFFNDYRFFSARKRKAFLFQIMSLRVDSDFGNILLNIPHYFTPLIIFEALDSAVSNMDSKLESIEEFIKFYQKHKIEPKDLEAYNKKNKYAPAHEAFMHQRISKGSKILLQGTTLSYISYEIEIMCALAKKALNYAYKDLNKKDRFVTSGDLAGAISDIKEFAEFYRKGQYFKEYWYNEDEKIIAQKAPQCLPLGLSPWKMGDEKPIIEKYASIKAEFKKYDWYKKHFSPFFYKLFFKFP